MRPDATGSSSGRRDAAIRPGKGVRTGAVLRVGPRERPGEPADGEEALARGAKGAGGESGEEALACQRAPEAARSVASKSVLGIAPTQGSVTPASR